jgi:hypothetical protein
MDVCLFPDGNVTLQAAENFRAFKVLSFVPRAKLKELLQRGTVPLLIHETRNDHLWVDVGAVRAASPLANDQAWQAGFAAMIEQARKFGWVSERNEICAHVEYAPPHAD